MCIYIQKIQIAVMCYQQSLLGYLDKEQVGLLLQTGIPTWTHPSRV